MVGVYRVELAKSARAGCQNTECKNKGVKIEKDELRFGTYVVINENGSWKWKHWGCVTPLQLTSWWETAEQDSDLLDGFDEIPEEQKEKVLRALHQGHVDDDDWKGDIEKNRPGQRGFRTPNKSKKSAAEDPAGSGHEESPTKAPPKKRGHGKTDDDETVADSAPAKKGRGRPKKAKIEDDEDEEIAEAAPPAKKRKTKKEMKEEANDDISTQPKKTKAPSVRDKAAIASDVEPEKPAPKARGRPKKLAATADVEEAPKATKGRKKKVAD